MAVARFIGWGIKSTTFGSARLAVRAWKGLGSTILGSESRKVADAERRELGIDSLAETPEVIAAPTAHTCAPSREKSRISFKIPSLDLRDRLGRISSLVAATTVNAWADTITNARNFMSMLGSNAKALLVQYTPSRKTTADSPSFITLATDRLTARLANAVKSLNDELKILTAKHATLEAELRSRTTDAQLQEQKAATKKAIDTAEAWKKKFEELDAKVTTAVAEALAAQRLRHEKATEGAKQTAVAETVKPLNARILELEKLSSGQERELSGQSSAIGRQQEELNRLVRENDTLGDLVEQLQEKLSAAVAITASAQAREAAAAQLLIDLKGTLSKIGAPTTELDSITPESADFLPLVSLVITNLAQKHIEHTARIKTLEADHTAAKDEHAQQLAQIATGLSTVLEIAGLDKVPALEAADSNQQLLALLLDGIEKLRIFEQGQAQKIAELEAKVVEANASLATTAAELTVSNALVAEREVTIASLSAELEALKAEQSVTAAQEARTLTDGNLAILYNGGHEGLEKETVAAIIEEANTIVTRLEIAGNEEKLTSTLARTELTKDEVSFMDFLHEKENEDLESVMLAFEAIATLSSPKTDTAIRYLCFAAEIAFGLHSDTNTTYRILQRLGHAIDTLLSSSNELDGKQLQYLEDSAQAFSTYLEFYYKLPISVGEKWDASGINDDNSQFYFSLCNRYAKLNKELCLKSPQSARSHAAYQNTIAGCSKALVTVGFEHNLDNALNSTERRVHADSLATKFNQVRDTLKCLQAVYQHRQDNFRLSINEQRRFAKVNGIIALMNS